MVYNDSLIDHTNSIIGGVGQCLSTYPDLNVSIWELKHVDVFADESAVLGVIRQHVDLAFVLQREI